VKVTRRQNCWDFIGCGRGPEAPRHERCRVADEEALDGFNGGSNGGRSCWAVVGSYGVDGFACEHTQQCSECDFRRLVAREELPDLDDIPRILERLGYADVLNLVCRPELEFTGRE
jgi:hypothetical protein